MVNRSFRISVDFELAVSWLVQGALTTRTLYPVLCPGVTPMTASDTHVGHPASFFGDLFLRAKGFEAQDAVCRKSFGVKC